MKTGLLLFFSASGLWEHVLAVSGLSGGERILFLFPRLSIASAAAGAARKSAPSTAKDRPHSRCSPAAATPSFQRVDLHTSVRGCCAQIPPSTDTPGVEVE